MDEVRITHTADLGPDELAAARHLLDDVFEGDFPDEDWEHTLGGMHALVWEAGELVAHGAVVQRRLLHAGRALRTGYVEGVGVRRDRRRRGLGGVVMAALERVVRAAYDLGALASSEQGLPLYTARSWRRWAGPTFALTPQGVLRTADEDGAVFVLEVGVPLDLTGELVCDWRDGDAW